MYSRVSLGVLLATLITSIRCESSFVLPPNAGPANNYQDNPSYNVGKTINVEWNSDLPSMDIIIWQQYPAPKKGTPNSVRLVDGFLTNVGEGEQVILYMALYQTASTDLSATSHYFNVTVPSSYTTTSTTATATSSYTEDAVSTPETATTTSGSASTTATNKSSSGLSTGAIAGIGAGSAIVGMLALGAVGFFFWKRSRKEKPGGEYTQSQQSPPPDEVKHELAGSGNNNAPPPNEVKHELAEGGWNNAPPLGDVKHELAGGGRNDVPLQRPAVGPPESTRRPDKREKEG
ncbi:hypothetical protein G7Z17_g2656 [Cylindrodendrum hubeiense]|uniref:Uncharacterized protein n=1 Tax=Cylindrodendrum hubeiense TaxID=595255 RepID=A0A9P5HCC1_9HYPO|nr:hypothetical protein G7Z17_g2656 [Cylindrodendrum hubeiense]